MEKNTTQQTPTSYPKTASILALVGGTLMLLSGVIFIAVAALILPHLDYSNLTVPQGLSPSAIPGLVSGIVGVMGAFGLVSGIIVLVSGAMLFAHVAKPRTWGILILIFSILSFVGLGGFIAGAILGIVGGIPTLRWKPSTS
jgi:hypothetical protein